METFLTHLWKSAVLITVFYGFYKLLLQKETYFNSIRYFLISGILFSICIPFITPVTYVEIAPIQTYAVESADSANMVNATNFDWALIILTVYSGVVLFLIIRFLMQLTATIRLISRHKTMQEGRYKFVETDSLSSPFSFFNYIVYNPTQFEKDELTQILAHEKAHVLQMHSIDNLFSNFLVVVLWFNPFVWLYKRTIEQNLEFIADEYAQKLTKSQQTYQQLLLKTTVPNYQMAMTNNFYNSLLKKRIIMLHKQRSNYKTQWKYVLIVPLLLAFIFTLNTKTLAQQKSQTKKIVNINTYVHAMVLDKKSSKSDLLKISSTFIDKGLTVKFSNIERNSSSEIVAINIDAKAKNGKAAASYASNLELGINPIQISYDKDNNNLTIGSSGDNHLNGYSYSKKGKGNSFVFISDDDDKNVWVTKKGSRKVIIETDSSEDEDNYDSEEVVKITTKSDGSKIIFNSGNKNERPLIILDGKEVTSKEMEAMDSDSIKSIDVIKGTKAIKKYGKKAKHGVIIIVSK